VNWHTKNYCSIQLSFVKERILDWIFISVWKDLKLLDFTRRYFERKGDRSSIRRTKEIRKFYKQIIRDYVSMIPEDIIEDHIKLFYDSLT